MFGFWKKRSEKWVKARLSTYIDGQLNPSERARVESHLKDCLDCEDELATLQSTVKALRHLPVVELPRSFTVPVLKPVSRPVVFYRLRLATVAVSVLLVAVIAGDSLGLFFGSEAPQPLMAPAPAAMPTPQSPASAMAPTTTPTPIQTPVPQRMIAEPRPTMVVTPITATPAPQDISGAAGKASPGIESTPAPSTETFQMQQAPAVPPAPLSIAAPTPTPFATPTPLQKTLPVGPEGPTGNTGLATESQEKATETITPATSLPGVPPTPQLLPSPVKQPNAEIVQPVPETPLPSQTTPEAPSYSWPVRQFEVALVTIVLILIMTTLYFWLKGTKED